ncbi:hypothetical protein [Kitasatospora mediocidica]|uniref:hypothetical protein n=1 Tax=Kitasatospora mediocidica TaxID=58352 RepID=UPI0012F7280A|nr:hypothetical protein [Kitasatospora mediocidica]
MTPTSAALALAATMIATSLPTTAGDAVRGSGGRPAAAVRAHVTIRAFDERAGVP